MIGARSDDQVEDGVKAAMAEPVAYQYRAFISHSHAYTAWAKWLHRALEGFRIDKDLVGRDTATGTIPKSLRPVFRDREDEARVLYLKYRGTENAQDEKSWDTVVLEDFAAMREAGLSHFLTDEIEAAPGTADAAEPKGSATGTSRALRLRRGIICNFGLKRLLAHRVGSVFAFVGVLRFGRLGAVGVAHALTAPVAALGPTAPLAASGVMLPVFRVALAILAAGAGLSATGLSTAGFGRLVFGALLVEVRMPAIVPAGAAIGGLDWLGGPLRLKLLRRHDDAVVVLGVLEIALGGHHVAGGQRVARERHVFLGDVRSGPADLHVGPVRFVAPRQCILGFTATAATAPAILLLLSLPHMPSSPDWRPSRILRSLLTLTNLRSVRTRFAPESRIGHAVVTTVLFSCCLALGRPRRYAS